MFKIKGQLTNVRPSKTESPELSTSPSKGMINLNGPAAKLIGVTIKDYVTIIDAQDDDNQDKLYLTTGSAGNDGANGQPKKEQVGAILSSPTGRSGGGLHFGSENAWRNLAGNLTSKKVYAINATPVEHEGKKYYELAYVRDEAKMNRKPKEAKA